ncbi:MAG TPA: hypothetical protein VHT03_06175 [Rhizomicrobium sp.]|jgi:ammonia channel protein AmtB|nr:hypothetical protein [Rhizomicrobium sp.]
MLVLTYIVGRLADPFAMMLGVTVGTLLRTRWQVLVIAFAAGLAIAGAVSITSPIGGDSVWSFMVEGLTTGLWGFTAFAVVSAFRRRRIASLGEDSR